jgi:transcriptional regulator with XRE-family HTH domain
MIKKHNKAFGNTLQNLRHEKMWSQEYLGFESDLSRAYISLLERGLRSPTLDTIMVLCDALEVSLVDLMALVQVELRDFDE